MFSVPDSRNKYTGRGDNDKPPSRVYEWWNAMSCFNEFIF